MRCWFLVGGNSKDGSHNTALPSFHTYYLDEIHSQSRIKNPSVTDGTSEVV
jgi:hypothetical protein